MFASAPGFSPDAGLEPPDGPAPSRTTRSPLRWVRLARRTVLVHRRGVAAVLAAAAVLMGWNQVSPPPPDTAVVAVAVHDLAGGQVVTTADVREISIDPALVPNGVVSTAMLIGEMTAAPVRGGQIFTDATLVKAALMAAQPGWQLMPVRVSDSSVAAMLRPGDLVDVFSVDPQTRRAALLGQRLRVVTVPAPVDPALGYESGALVVLSVPKQSSKSFIEATATTSLGVAWSG